jgi:hypothetical protein
MQRDAQERQVPEKAAGTAIKRACDLPLMRVISVCSDGSTVQSAEEALEC